MGWICWILLLLLLAHALWGWWCWYHPSPPRRRYRVMRRGGWYMLETWQAWQGRWVVVASSTSDDIAAQWSNDYRCPITRGSN